MSHENKNVIEVFHEKELICSINSDSPSLTDIVDKIILNQELEVDKLICKSEIDNFDTSGFTEVLVNTIKSIRTQLATNVDEYEKALESIEKDDDIMEYYQSLSSIDEK
jgi:hypothetical protein